jgi:periplasmic protein TonB
MVGYCGRILIGCTLMWGTVAVAQGTPGSPGSPTTPQTPPQQPGQPTLPATNDPGSMPTVPPTFAPGVGSGDNSAPSARHKSVRISGGVMAGMLVSKVDPVYPEAARSAGVQGFVVLSARIGKDGHVVSLSAVSGPPALQASAIDAVKQWVYRPFLLNGDPVEVDTTITVNFNLTHPPQ